MADAVFVIFPGDRFDGSASRIHDRLASLLGPDADFVSLQDVPVGVDFRSWVSEQVSRSGLVLAVIGNRWAPTPLVELQLGSAIDRGIPIIPVLADGVAMPSAEALPETLKRLANLRPFVISQVTFDEDVEALSRVVLSALHPAMAGAPPPSSAPRLSAGRKRGWGRGVRREIGANSLGWGFCRHP